MRDKVERKIDSLVDALTDPIVVFDPSWADTIPDWLKSEIQAQRLVQLMKGEEGASTDAEALAYVSKASLKHPLDSDWVGIYQYLLTRVMGDKVPGELRQESLASDQTRLLGDLKGWLWRKRIKGREERGRAERARAKAEAKAEAGAKQAMQLPIGL